MRALVLFPLSLFLLTVSKCVCTEKCAYILLGGSCQPPGSYTINVPRMTGETTNMGVRSGRSVLMPKCETNPFPKPKLHKCANSLLSTRSQSRESGESSALSGPAANLFWSTLDNHPDSHHLDHQVTFTAISPENCSHLPVTLNAHETLQGVFSPLNFPNCLQLQSPSKACQGDADDKNYFSRAPLPLPELMWSI